jgi:hypothetical protein
MRMIHGNPDPQHWLIMTCFLQGGGLHVVFRLLRLPLQHRRRRRLHHAAPPQAGQVLQRHDPPGRRHSLLPRHGPNIYEDIKP